MYQQLTSKPIQILGCGNTLLGDDGFGPAVIEHLLTHHQLPDEVHAADVGTGIRDLLFDLLLSPTRPRLLILVDAADPPDLAPGELAELTVSQVDPAKAHDFSVHHFPSLNLLRELATQTATRVRILAVKVAARPEQVNPGLSPPVAAAVPRASAWILQILQEIARA
ncbi:MAG: hydrogenase maturation protease [Deltaproteobacteria bacterium]|nr:hydrogenase maturation protease [Deltaproteobacteria bacterium]